MSTVISLVDLVNLAFVENSSSAAEHFLEKEAHMSVLWWPSRLLDRVDDFFELGWLEWWTILRRAAFSCFVG